MNQIKPKSGYWANYPKTYRAEEIATIAQWVATGECGAIIGGSGTGKSNLIGFVHTHPDVLYAQLPARQDSVYLLHFDINSLPMLNAAFFYRGMIQTLQQATQDFDPTIAEQVQQLFQNNVNWDDAFTAYSMLQATHRILIQSGVQLVWLLDRFDQACQQLDAQTLNSLRSLRDQFKGQLCYVIATRHPLSRLRDPGEIDEFHEIIAANSCWLGPMVERDARWVAAQMADRLNTTFHPMEVALLIEITGGLPAFMKAACTALAEGALGKKSSAIRWVDNLLVRAEFQRNCREIWDDLQPEEQQVLRDLTDGNPMVVDMAPDIVSYLISSGLVQSDAFTLFSPLFTQYIYNEQINSQQEETVSGIVIHPQTQDVLRDGILLAAELTNHEDRLLNYFLVHVSEVCTKEELMGAVWSDEVIVKGVRDDRLAQLIKRLRDKIEPMPSSPIYIQTVRGRGYRFVQG